MGQPGEMIWTPGFGELITLDDRGCGPIDFVASTICGWCHAGKRVNWQGMWRCNSCGIIRDTDEARRDDPLVPNGCMIVASEEGIRGDEKYLSVIRERVA